VRELRQVRKPTLDVLTVLMDGETCGSEITARTGLWHPTVYAVLARLADHGWTTSRWEEREPAAPGQLRRFYTLLPDARREARALLARRRHPSTVDVPETHGQAA
jgi:DNA-binding PadR family transcriptional regulator